MSERLIRAARHATQITITPTPTQRDGKAYKAARHDDQSNYKKIKILKDDMIHKKDRRTHEIGGNWWQQVHSLTLGEYKGTYQAKKRH